MSPDTQFLLSVLLTFGVPIAIAVRELLVLRRGRPDDRRPRRPVTPPLAPADGRPRLPDCLIPRKLPPGLLPRLPDADGPAPSRRREREPA